MDAGDPQKRKPRKNLLNLTLRGLPELDHFPTLDARQKALDELGTEAGNPKSMLFWMGVTILVVGVFIAQWIAGWLLSLVVWPRFLEELLHAIAIFGGFVLLLAWLHRSGTSRDLRGKLLTCGVPVCMQCGYLLRGLPSEIGRCPECGTQFSPRARELLAQSPLDGIPRAPGSL